MSSAPAGRGPPGFAGGQFEGELSPEDLFNMFFGGGPMGPMGMAGTTFRATSFGGGPSTYFVRILFCFYSCLQRECFRSLVFTATFGPGGFRTMRTGGGGGGAGAAGGEQRAEAQPQSMLVRILPILILFLFSVLNVLPSLFGPSMTPDPQFAFVPSGRYNVERQTGGLGIKYHVNGAEFSGHPIAAELARNGNQPGPELRRFESDVERSYTSQLYRQCQHAMNAKERRKEAEIGLFGIGTDWEKVKKIDQEPVESCQRLKDLGLLK